ncbi:hypothetical protein [Hanstruepera ponticola]|uniref:hypothetical protein n=1 Tax=Hanstruepera ponticola TaxID=2042995 RepID=UPI0017854584|nr:hypothetical protein [Hanstruepera ponticola]
MVTIPEIVFIIISPKNYLIAICFKDLDPKSNLYLLTRYTDVYWYIIILIKMARNTSFIKLEGTLDGLTFYNKDGENVVKTKSSVSKNRIMNDPTYKRTRENMIEFGGASKVAKAFRDAFANVVRLMGDTYLSGRLNRTMKLINKNGSGVRGERDFDVVSMRDILLNFEFNLNDPFNTQFFAPSGLPSINATRDIVTWLVPDFDTDSYLRAPEGATHFKLVLAAGYVDNYVFEKTTETYVPTDELVNGRGDVFYSDAIALGGMVGADTTLTVDMSALGVIPASSALFATVGIVFYQEINSELYVLAQGNAMKVAVTG